MESLEQLRRKLDSAQDLRTIVKTMKALSAASIRQYEQAAHAVSGYYRTVRRGLQVVLADGHSRFEPRRSQFERRAGAIVFGSDHGLCGRFNEEVAKYAQKRIESFPGEWEQPAVLAVGARVAASLGHEGKAPGDTFFVPGSAAQITATVQRILQKMDHWTKNDHIGEIHLFYNQQSRGQGHQPTSLRLLPIDLERIRDEQAKGWPSRTLPTFTMQQDVLLSLLLRQYLFVSIFRACVESLASEHASRLAAMQSAERNLDERLEDVTMLFRRARQRAITAELLDVVSGFEATAGRET